MTDVAVPVTTRKDWASDQEVRWCPGCGDYTILSAVQLLLPELGVRRENTVFISGIGCAARFPYYMNTYGMHSIHGRAPGHRHGPRRHPPRSRRLGGHRRRRRALDRRQPPHARPAAQRQPHDPAVQQPDLRLDQGPVLADLRGGQGHQVDAVRLARHALQPDQPRPRRRGELRRPHPRPRPQAHDGDLPPGPRPPGRLLRRGLPELQRLQRRRLRGDQRQGAPGGHADPARARQADPLRGRRRARRRRRRRRAASASSRSPTSARTPRSSTTRSEPIPAWPSPSPASPPGPTSRLRSGCSAPSSARTTAASSTHQLLEAQERQGPGELSALLRSGATWSYE